MDELIYLWRDLFLVFVLVSESVFSLEYLFFYNCLPSTAFREFKFDKLLSGLLSSRLVEWRAQDDQSECTPPWGL